MFSTFIYKERRGSGKGVSLFYSAGHITLPQGYKEIRQWPTNWKLKTELVLDWVGRTNRQECEDAPSPRRNLRCRMWTSVSLYSSHAFKNKAFLYLGPIRPFSIHLILVLIIPGMIRQSEDSLISSIHIYYSFLWCWHSLSKLFYN